MFIETTCPFTVSLLSWLQMKSQELSPSLEDYLETILHLETKNRVARVKDIAENLNVQMPSVTNALKNLKARGYINYEKNSFIHLTEDGMSIASEIDSRHRIITNFLVKLLYIDTGTAEETACKIEHSIDNGIAERIEKMVKFLTSEKMNNKTFLKEWQNAVLSDEGK